MTGLSTGAPVPKTAVPGGKSGAFSKTYGSVVDPQGNIVGGENEHTKKQWTDHIPGRSSSPDGNLNRVLILNEMPRNTAQ
jgi:hypothetical protein